MSKCKDRPDPVGLDEEVANPSTSSAREHTNVLGASNGTLQPASSWLCLVPIKQGFFFPTVT